MPKQPGAPPKTVLNTPHFILPCILQIEYRGRRDTAHCALRPSSSVRGGYRRGRLYSVESLYMPHENERTQNRLVYSHPATTTAGGYMALKNDLPSYFLHIDGPAIHLNDLKFTVSLKQHLKLSGVIFAHIPAFFAQYHILNGETIIINLRAA